MKRLLLLTVLLSLLISCSGRKQVEKAVNTGDYNQAIATALKKLRTNKDAKRKQDYVLMLQDAYYKAEARDLSTVEHLKKDNNPELYRDIYEIYRDLNNRQEAIKPLLPLYINGKKIPFRFKDYNDAIITSRENVSNYYYEQGLDLLEYNDKTHIREAYKKLKYIESVNPNYENTRDLLDEAHARGTNYVLVSIINNTHQIIPRRLESNLLNFNTYGLNQFWTVYHTQANINLHYDYAMELRLKRINISPEKINETQILREREIIDGWEYKNDAAGHIAKDSLGNAIKIDKIINARCRLIEYEQIKSTQIIADVVYINLNTKQLLDSFSIDSKFLFNHFYGRVRGDKRALTPEDKELLNNRRMPFPDNQQMVYDTGEDLKLKLKDIINTYKI